MTARKLQAENEELRLRLEEAEETIRAIQSGAVDAFVVAASGGHRVYTLEAADRPYRLFVEQMQQGAATLQADGTIVYCNDQLADLLQTAPEKLIGTALGDFVATDDRTTYDNLFRQGQTRTGRGEARLRAADGGLVPGYLTFSALPSECGAAIGVLVTDLTTQRHHEQLAAAHQALQLSEATRRFAMQAGGTGSWTWDGASGTVTWSEETYELFGIDPQTPLLYESWRSALHSDDRERADVAAQQALERGHDLTVEYRIRHPLRGERWLTSIGRIVDPVNRPGYMTGISMDITERKQAEHALRRSEERFRLMADAVPVLIWVSDITKACTWFNKCWREFSGRSLEELLGDGWAQDVHSADLDGCLHVYSTHFDARQPFTMEYRLQRHDGEYRWVVDNGVPRFDSDGEFVGYIGSCVDFTERIRMEDALREGDRRKDEFLAVLAHELRNPLAPIRNSMHILRMTAQNDPAAERVTEMMERQVNNMVRLVDDLMEVSRITRGKIELRKERIEVAAFIRSAVETSRPHIDAAGHNLTVAIPPEPLIVEGDPVRLAQVVANLLNNAAKYTEPGGQIWLTARQDVDVVAISVRDTGTGIPTDMLPRVFELFTQVDRHESRAQGGLGIGLALVKNLVDLHGGSVNVHSEGAGRGCEFVVRLPLSIAQLPADLPRRHDRGTDNPAPCRVLVVDDNHDAANSLAMLLKLIGTDVHVVYNGPDALEAFATCQPAVVLLDIGMPGMDGYEVARRIRLEPRSKSVTLIALTGWGQEEDRNRSRDAGFDHHLIKPPEFSRLKTLLISLESRHISGDA